MYEVDEKVADVFNINESNRICIEVLDGFIFKLLGTHFLEPTSKSNLVVQVVPSVKDKVRQDGEIRRNTMAKQRITEAAKPRPLDKGGIGNTIRFGLDDLQQQALEMNSGNDMAFNSNSAGNGLGLERKNG